MAEDYKKENAELRRRMSILHQYASKLGDEDIARNLRAIAAGKVKAVVDKPKRSETCPVTS